MKTGTDDQPVWQKEFDSLPEWAKQLVRGAAGCGGYGGFSRQAAPHLFAGFGSKAAEKWEVCR